MFEAEIEKYLGGELFPNNYKIVVSDENNTFFVKRYSDKLAIYIRCVVERDIMDVELYFTAVQVPDKRIADTNTGINIYIAFCNSREETLRSAGRRALAVANNIGTFEEIVLGEMEKPFFTLKANHDYYANTRVYNTIANDADLQEELAMLKEKVCKMIREKENQIKIKGLCSDFLNQLPADYFESKGVDFTTKEIKRCFAQQVYAECILDA